MKKWLNKNIICFSLASFFNDFCHEMTTVILPTFINQLVGPLYAPTALGFIQGIADISATIMRLISGFLADKITSYKPFLIIGYGLTGTVGLIGTAHTIGMTLFYKTIAWMSRGIREPIRDTWISKTVPSKFYGRAFGFHRASDTFGSLIGPLCAFFLLKLQVPLTSIFLISIIPGIISVIPILFLTNNLTHEKKDLSTITFRKQLQQLPSHFNYFLLVMFIFRLANFNKALLIYRSQELISRIAISSPIATGWAILFYVFFNFVRSISEFSIGSLSDFLNRKNLLALLGFGVFGITSLGFMIAPANKAILFVLFACAGLSAGTIKSLEKSYAASLLPEPIRGTGLGTLQALDGCGNLLSSIIVGALWSFVSPAIGFFYATVLSFIALFLLVLKK